MSSISPEDLKQGLQKLERLKNESLNLHESYKLGRILTIVDSALSDPQQRKATKDLVQNAWYEGGPSPMDLNYSDAAMLYKHLTNEKLWDTDPPPVNVEYNPFAEK